MHKVVIIGGGFGGLAAAGVLGRTRGVVLTLIDRKSTADCLPLLPDILGGRITPEACRASLAALAPRAGFRFVRDQVLNLDPAKRMITGQAGTYPYDYALVAAGSGTHFYGNEQARKTALTLDDVSEAVRIRAAADAGTTEPAVIVGGGYTGVEIATNLRRRFSLRKQARRIVVVELSDSILKPLPEWMKRYAKENLERLEIEVISNSQVKEISPGRVALSGGERFESPLLIWAAGVQTPDFVRKLPAPQNRQGRLEVDDFLRIDDRVFSAGDTVCWTRGGAPPVRMGVQFSLAQGELAAANMVRTMRGRPLKRYVPRDLGYIVPMANGRSCGIAMGMNIRGPLASCLHYAMCAFRSFGLRQKLAVIGSVLWGRGTMSR